jgi:PAS domain S-box-containing protein
VRKIGDLERTELSLLERRLERERSIRLEAEAITERVTRELYDKQRELELMQATAAAANEAATVEGAMQTALDRICAHTGWPVGHAYVLAHDSPGELVSAGVWHVENPERFHAFLEATEALRFPPGMGLPGRVLSDKKPVWITDVTREANFPRRKQAEGCGIRAGFGFPVLAGADVVGVLEFFSPEPAEPDERLLEVMAHVGAQLGRVVERKQAGDELQRAYQGLELQVRFRTAELETANRVLQAEVEERRRTEAMLRDNEERYRTLVEHTYDLITETTMDGRFLYLSPKHKDILGYEPEELVGRSIFENIHPGDRSPVMAEFGRAIRTLSSGRVVYRFRHKNGSWKWFEGTGKPFRTAAGDVRGVIASRDLTESKRAEEKQTQILRELESANRELKDFAYVVSHDLKAPLRAIGSLSSWIAADYRDKLDEDGREQLDLLTNRVKRMHNLIDGILQYSRVGRVKEERVRVNLNDVVAQVIDMIAPPDNIRITLEPGLPPVYCEKTRIEQVFQNLLSNAIKFMDKPEGEIRIACVPEGDSWKFSVADNGPGIEEKYFEKIFQIFQTLRPRDEAESTGVGLALVKKIVEIYGGRVWVESDVGSGTTFFFTLPRRGKEEQEPGAGIQESE